MSNQHITGLTQLSFDEVHGSVAFAKLSVPGLTQRQSKHDEYLPATERHPRASGRFRSALCIDRPGYTDLGPWNAYANPYFPNPQQSIRHLLCQGDARDCDPADLLPGTIALFKTPELRDLGHSNPYLHDGSREQLEEVIRFYLQSSALAHSGALRNAASELKKMHLDAADIPALGAFLRSLKEDYE